MSLCVLLALAAASCRDCPEVNPKVPLYCAPCSGKGETVVINTERPVAIAHITYWDLCFAQTIEERCWYGCPGPLDETVYKGAEICAKE